MATITWSGAPTISASMSAVVTGQRYTISWRGSQETGAPNEPTYTVTWTEASGTSGTLISNTTSTSGNDYVGNAAVTAITYTVTEVVGGVANPNTASVTININQFTNVAAADGTSTSFSVSQNGQQVVFSGSVNLPSGVTATAWSWDFGDNSPHGTQQVSYRNYSAAGTYTVKLTVTDSNNQTATSTVNVVVLANPTFSLATTPHSLVAYSFNPLSLPSGFNPVFPGTPKQLKVYSFNPLTNTTSFNPVFYGTPLKQSPFTYQVADWYNTTAFNFHFFYPGNGKIPGSPIPQHGQLLPRPL